MCNDSVGEYDMEENNYMKFNKCMRAYSDYLYKMREKYPDLVLNPLFLNPINQDNVIIKYGIFIYHKEILKISQDYIITKKEILKSCKNIDKKDLTTLLGKLMSYVREYEKINCTLYENQKEMINVIVDGIVHVLYFDYELNFLREYRENIPKKSDFEMKMHLMKYYKEDFYPENVSKILNKILGKNKNMLNSLIKAIAAPFIINKKKKSLQIIYGGINNIGYFLTLLEQIHFGKLYSLDAKSIGLKEIKEMIIAELKGYSTYVIMPVSDIKKMDLNNFKKFVQGKTIKINDKSLPGNCINYRNTGCVYLVTNEARVRDYCIDNIDCDVVDLMDGDIENKEEINIKISGKEMAWIYDNLIPYGFWLNCTRIRKNPFDNKKTANAFIDNFCKIEDGSFTYLYKLYDYYLSYYYRNYSGQPLSFILFNKEIEKMGYKKKKPRKKAKDNCYAWIGLVYIGHDQSNRNKSEILDHIYIDKKLKEITECNYIMQ